jgi:glutamate 5-kinase
MHRRQILHVTRVVIKFGTRILLDETGCPDLTWMRLLVKQVADLRRDGIQVVLVTSGAIGSGMEVLDIKQRPTELADLQMAAAVGQARLMTNYAQFFSEFGCVVGQILLTYDDLKSPTRRENARHTMLRLIERGVVPIVNENDVVAVDEIKVGDNDILAAMVSTLVDAQALVLCSTTDGLQDGTGRVPFISKLTPEILSLANGKGSDLSTGGMATKLMAAAQVTDAGAVALIIDGRKSGEILRAMQGEDCGTYLTQNPC